jgi:hypothetical protein
MSSLSAKGFAIRMDGVLTSINQLDLTESRIHGNEPAVSTNEAHSI